MSSISDPHCNYTAIYSTHKHRSSSESALSILWVASGLIPSTIGSYSKSNRKINNRFASSMDQRWRGDVNTAVTRKFKMKQQPSWKGVQSLVLGHLKPTVPCPWYWIISNLCCRVLDTGLSQIYVIVDLLLDYLKSMLSCPWYWIISNLCYHVYVFLLLVLRYLKSVMLYFRWYWVILTRSIYFPSDALKCVCVALKLTFNLIRYDTVTFMS